MDNKEYLMSLIARFNADPNDQNFTKAEKVLLLKVLEAQKKVSNLVQQGAALEKELNDKRKALMELEAEVNREKVKSDTYTEILFSMR